MYQYMTISKINGLVYGLYKTWRGACKAANAQTIERAKNPLTVYVFNEYYYKKMMKKNVPKR